MKKVYLIFYVILITTLNSCKKYVEAPAPKNLLLGKEVFSDSSNATSAVLGIYINMMPNFTNQITNGGLSVLGGLSADEITRTTNNTNENQFYNNAILTTNALNASLWSIGYNIIYNANACVEGLNASLTLPMAVKNRLLGEAKVSRAFIYFYLLNLYGPVPLVVSTDYSVNKVLPRASVDSVYSFIISELKDAQSYLSADYSTNNRFRPNTHTVNSLLAKVYLLKKDWANTEVTSSEVINSGIYTLEGNLNDVFLMNTNEAIWRLEVLYPSIETWNGYSFLPVAPPVRPTYRITNNLLNAFESGDQRKVNWTKFNVVASQTYYYPYKYKIRNSSATKQESFVVFRLAELYLIRAEARLKQNNLNGAIADLNIIRNRSGLSDLQVTLNAVQIESALENERRVELFCEWGNRWFDLKRWDKATLVLAPLKANWQPTDVLYPVPQIERNRNQFLDQNEGY